jgi:signal transduction histidine kinase
MGVSSIILIVVLLGVVALAALLIWIALQSGARSHESGRALPAPATIAAHDVSHAMQSAVNAERERIYADLHDDVGAKLLELIYRAPTPDMAALARSALKDLRDVVSRTRGERASLLESLGEMQAEAHARLEAADIELEWRQDEDIADRPLNHLQHLHLFRIVREAISNVIRHAQAQSLRVRLIVAAEILRIEIKDDGVGQEQAGAGGGRGKHNMRKRADALAGHVTWRGGTLGGTHVLLSLPLAADALPGASER